MSMLKHILFLLHSVECLIWAEVTVAGNAVIHFKYFNTSLFHRINLEYLELKGEA